MRVLLVCPEFPPILNSTARLYSELANEFISHGHDVSVLTRTADRHVEDSQKPHPFELFSRDYAGDVRVIRIRGLPGSRRIPLFRILDQFWMALTFLLAGLMLPRHDGVIVYSPPLPLGLTGWILGRKWRGIFVLNVQDLHPRTAVDLGLLRGRYIIRWAEALEQFLYRKADKVTVHSNGNREHVLKLVCDSDKVHTIPNWIDLEINCPGPDQSELRRSLGLDDMFVLFFGGNMGFAQGLESVIDAAGHLQSNPKIAFVLAGDGALRQMLENQISEKQLNNVLMLPPQPEEAYLKLLQMADACLVTLHEELTTPVVPGKLQSIMAVGKPAICRTNPASDVYGILDQAQCGLFVSPQNPKGLTEAVLTLVNNLDLAKKMGERGRRYAERNFEKASCIQLNFNILEESLDQRNLR